MSRMRTIKDAVRCIKENDPESAFSEYALRKMVKAGTVPHIMVGNRALVDVDNLDKILCAGAAAPTSAYEPPLTPDRARIINSQTLSRGFRFTGNPPERP